MKLGRIIEALGAGPAGSEDVDVSGVCFDSRDVTPGALFVAVSGAHVDGGDFIGDAADRGAAAVITERPASGLDVPQIVVADARSALAAASAEFYSHPADELTVVGITGTNGKTTTAYLVEAVLKSAGFSAGVIGTVNYRFGGGVYEAPHTTPEAPELQKLLREMVSSGVTHCVMEVSSHALHQKRVEGCSFDAAVFTNLTHEHLDYHHTMEEYFEAKASLFGMMKPAGGRGVINTDDPWGRALAGRIPGSLTYGLSGGPDVRVLDSSLGEGGTEARILTPAGEVGIRTALVGEYNLLNILGAVAAGCALGIPPEAVSRGIASLERVPGRLEKAKVPAEAGFTAYVDYAHTPDALARALSELDRLRRGGRIITVFGCGGDRDRTKRPEMGEASAKVSDITVITSDNPRTEDPFEIIREIEAGIDGVARVGPDEDADGGFYTVIPDRGRAIRRAVSLAKRGDIILVAGKGHEDYQIVGESRHHFDDLEELAGAVNELLGRGPGS